MSGEQTVSGKLEQLSNPSRCSQMALMGAGA